MKPPEIKVSDVFKNGNVTIDVQVKEDWRFRIALVLLWLAGKVLRCNFEFRNGLKHGEQSQK